MQCGRIKPGPSGRGDVRGAAASLEDGPGPPFFFGPRGPGKLWYIARGRRTGSRGFSRGRARPYFFVGPCGPGKLRYIALGRRTRSHGFSRGWAWPSLFFGPRGPGNDGTVPAGDVLGASAVLEDGPGPSFFYGDPPLLSPYGGLWGPAFDVLWQPWWKRPGHVNLVGREPLSSLLGEVHGCPLKGR